MIKIEAVMVGLFLCAFFPSTMGQVSSPDTAQIEREVMEVLDEFMRTFSNSDPEAHIATYHFPHHRLARGTMTTLESRESGIEWMEQVFRALPDSGWHESVWVHRRVVTIGESKVHVDTRFRRLREDGSEIGTYDSLYILTKVNDQWGIRMRSSFL